LSSAPFVLLLRTRANSHAGDSRRPWALHLVSDSGLSPAIRPLGRSPLLVLPYSSWIQACLYPCSSQSNSRIDPVQSDPPLWRSRLAPPRVLPTLASTPRRHRLGVGGAQSARTFCADDVHHGRHGRGGREGGYQVGSDFRQHRPIVHVGY